MRERHAGAANPGTHLSVHAACPWGNGLIAEPHCCLVLVQVRPHVGLVLLRLMFLCSPPA